MPSTRASQRPSRARMATSSRARMSSTASSLSKRAVAAELAPELAQVTDGAAAEVVEGLGREAAHLLELLGGRRLSGAEHLGEQPRRAHGAAGEHHSRGAAVQQPQRRVPPVHVAGGDHRHGQRRRERERHRVVGKPAVQLRRRARVDADRRGPRLDQPRRERRPETVARAQAGPDLDGHGHRPARRSLAGRAHHGGDDGGGEVRLRQQRRPGARLDDLAHRARHVEVDHVGAGLHRAPGCVGQHVRVSAEQLEPERMLVLTVREVVERAPVVVVHSVGGDHLGEDESGAPAAHAAPERRSGESGHRRHDEAAVEPELADRKRAKQRIGCGRRRVAGSPRVGRRHACHSRRLSPAAGAASRSRCRAA